MCIGISDGHVFRKKIVGPVFALNLKEVSVKLSGHCCKKLTATEASKKAILSQDSTVPIYYIWYPVLLKPTDVSNL